MELKSFKNLYHYPASFWLGITFIVWWTGLGGKDLYLLPALIFILIYIYLIWRNKPLNIPAILRRRFYSKKWMIMIFSVHVVLFLTITILKYFSFSWNVWDVGNFSNKLYNIAHGSFYSSYLDAHDWADHFNPSMSPLALLYLIVPSTNWVTLAKKIQKQNIHNIILLRERGEFLDEYLTHKRINCLHINFPDPWSKKSKRKHRILCAEFLTKIHPYFFSGGELRFKTDHLEYFKSVTQILKQLGFYSIDQHTEDLHQSPYDEENILTEFEMLFKSKGNPPIGYLRARAL